ncbi:MAG: hypothetical protein GC165_19025 [Armatimonadetes bacterium]|nr:hypothetical protein [Armatimonadota bacterium]
MKLAASSLARMLCFVLFILTVVSCGGSATVDVSPQLTIDWPSLTRGFEAPTYAGSAVITIQSDDPNVSPVTWTVDRPARTNAQSVTTTSPSPFHSTTARLNIDFKSDAGGQGPIVASATLDVKITSDGTLLNLQGGSIGTIGYATTLDSLYNTTPDFSVGDTQTISVVGLSKYGEVALPQQLIDTSISSGGQYATLDHNQLHGVKAGLVTVQSVFEGITITRSIEVKPLTINVPHYHFPVAQIAYDSLHNTVWGTDPTNKTIVDINLASGQMGTPISLSDTPTDIAISADGTTAYVMLANSPSLPMIDTSTRSISHMIDLSAVGSDPRAIFISVNPVHANEVAVCAHQAPDHIFGVGPVVYRDGIEVGTPSGTSTIARYTSETELVGTTIGLSSGPMSRFQVSSNSVDAVQGKDTGQFFVGTLNVSGSRVLYSDGRVFSATDLSDAGVYGAGFRIPTTDLTTNNLWSVGTGSAPHLIVCIDANTLKWVDYQTMPNNAEIQGMVRTDATGLAILADGDLYVLSTAPGL